MSKFASIMSASPKTMPDLPTAIKKPRGHPEIINIQAIKTEIETSWQNTETPNEFKEALLEILRKSLKTGSQVVKERFLSKNNGAETVVSQAFLMDSLIQITHETIIEKLYRAPNPTQGEQLCIVAVGGYGRGELAPFSDIDLLFLLPYKLTPHTEQVVETILYLLWDMRLKVGHSTRSIQECMHQAKADMTIRTAILESRFIIGEVSLLNQMIKRFQREVVAGTALDFVEAKLKESENRHKKLGDSRYVIEPNIKDGKGGLRDLHKLFWIAKYVYQTNTAEELVTKGILSSREANHFAKAQKQLWTIRCHLHYLTGREEDRLTVDHQREIATKLGYTDRSGNIAVERFMKHYYLTAKNIGDLTRIFCAAIEEEHQRKPRLRIAAPWQKNKNLGDFKLEGGRLNSMSDVIFDKDPVNLIRMFYVAQQNELEFHPHILRLVTQNLKKINRALQNNPEANRLFLEILISKKGPERILRRMSESQVFGRFVPDFGRVVAQMQYDMYHVYTVDEHTIIMLGILFKIESGELEDTAPVASKIVHKVISRKELYVAVLLHDIAKGRGGDHSILGEKVARRLCPRFGLSKEETETVAWLVRWHLLLSYAAFKRDINDPKTIEDLNEIVQSPERLKLLLVLTVADIRAVGPNVWNGWKGALLRDLFFKAEEVLLGQSPKEGLITRANHVHAQLQDALSEWKQVDYEEHIKRGYPSYWLMYDIPTLTRHAELVLNAESKNTPLTIQTQRDYQKEVTEITVYTADHPGLFSRIAGAMASIGANIVDARITTMRNGMALDSFWVYEPKLNYSEKTSSTDHINSAIELSLNGELKINDAIKKRPGNFPKRARSMTTAPRVLIDNKASTTHTVLEVNGTDRPGLLHQLTRKIAQQNLQINSAKISTYGTSIVDVFYVKDLFGLKIQSDRRINIIKESMLDELKLSSEIVRMETTKPQTK